MVKKKNKKNNNELPRPLKWIGIVLLIPLALLSLVVLVNVVDQNVSPEAATFAEHPAGPVRADENAYYAVLGHTAAAADNAHQKGVEIVEAYNRVATDDPKALEDDVRVPVLGNNRLQFEGKISELCLRTVERCLEYYRQHANEITQLLRTNRVLLRRYYALYRYPQFQETAKDTPLTLIPYDDSLTSALARAAIGLKASNGQIYEALNDLDLDMQYQRLLLENSRLLVTKMIAVRRIRGNLQLLSEIISVAPPNAANTRMIRKLLEPFTPAELSLDNAFRSEFNIAKSYDSWSRQDQNRSGWDVISQPLFKRNASINLMYERYALLAEISKLPARQLIEELRSGRAESKLRKQTRGLHRLYNPVGKHLAGMTSLSSWTTYIARTQNLEALRRLVEIQLIAKTRRINDAAMPSFLQETGGALRNPYTDQPAEWNAITRTVSFDVMEEDHGMQLFGRRLDVYR